MKQLLTTMICALILHAVGRAQTNLVLNPNFEQFNTCPDQYDEAKYADHWMSLDSNWAPPDWTHDPPGVPDYCHTCATSFCCSVPLNRGFFHHPHSGNGMMQIQLLVDLPDNFYTSRDYLQGHLFRTLTSGHTYCVSFFTTRAQGGPYAINNLGAYLDDGSIDTTLHPGWNQTHCNPQIIDTNIIVDTLNWEKIEGTFTANGTEKIITIGNFRARAFNHFITTQDTTGSGGVSPTWYLIDDVSVIDCTNTPHAGNDTFTLHPGDSVFIGPHEELLPYWWYVLGGTVPIDSGGGIWVKPTVTTTYILKQVLCDRVAYDTVKVRVWPDTVTNVAMAQLLNGSIYPSPTKGLLTVEGVKGCTVSVYDVLGREVLGGIVATEKEVLDLEQLIKGVYMVVVTDRVTGFRVVRQVLKE